MGPSIRRYLLRSAVVVGMTGALTWLLTRPIDLVAWRGDAALRLVLLTGGALACAVAARSGAIRLSPAFLLACAVSLPHPAALLCAVAAYAPLRGRGFAGPDRPTAVAAIGVTAAVLALQALATAGLPDRLPELALLAVLFLVAQAAAWSVVLLLTGFAAVVDSTGAPDPRLERTLAEAVSVPLAFLLIVLLARRADVAAMIAGGLIVAAALVLRRLHEKTARLRRTAARLAARESQLATIDAIGREVASSLDLPRVFAALESECRKIFPLDHFAVALLDRRGRPELTYTRRRGQPADDRARPVGDGLWSWVAVERRRTLIGDLAEFANGPTGLRDDVPAGIRSLIAAPMTVDGSVIGVLSLQSGEPGAYDDERLGLLDTIARQAAVAVERARHHALATIDGLTGVYQRDYFFRRLEGERRRALRYGGDFSVLMLDLDGFKRLNDRHGHLAGDRYLSAAGETIRSLLRGPDLAGRFGGDEFCIALPATGLEGARTFAERLRSEISRLAVEHEGVVLRTTVSIGLGHHLGTEGAELSALLRTADRALYRAKRAGRDRVVVPAA